MAVGLLAIGQCSGITMQTRGLPFARCGFPTKTNATSQEAPMARRLAGRPAYHPGRLALAGGHPGAPVSPVGQSIRLIHADSARIMG
jgi:hypothetical protein